MACKTEIKMIDEKEYTVTQWNATLATINKLKLIKVFGSSLAILASNEFSGKKSKLTGKDISDAVEALFKNSEPEETVKLIKSSIVGIFCEGKRITEASFEDIFSGDSLLTMYKVFLFVIKVNYGNLFKGQKAQAILTKVEENL